MPATPPSTEHGEHAVDSQESTNAAGPSPGEQLRQAREQAGVSLQVVAERTLISLHKLQALERDDYGAVGGTAHVTGYTRAYARVLGLDAKALVHSVESALGAERAHAEADRAALAASTPRGMPRYMPVVGGVLLVLIVVWVGLWLSGDEAEPTAGAQPPAVTAEADTGETSDAGVETTTAQGVAPDPNLATTGANGQQSPVEARLFVGEAAPVDDATVHTDAHLGDGAVDVSAEPEPARGPDEVSTQTAAAAISPPASGETLDAIASAEEEREVHSPSVESAAPTAVEQVLQEPGSASLDQLQLTFVSDCWLEVSDATGRKLVADLALAGSTREVKGVAPFQVLLGDAAAASEIALNQQAVPFAPRPGRRVLRMTIGD